MTKRIFARLFIIMSVCLLTNGLALCAYAQPNQNVIAELEKAEGAVEIKDSGGQWKKAVPGMRISMGDYIKTGRRSGALILIINQDEKVKIKILEETETSLKDIIVNNLTGKQDSSVLLDDGTIGVAANDFHKNTSFKAVTPNAIVEMGKYGVSIKYNKSPE